MFGAVGFGALKMGYYCYKCLTFWRFMVFSGRSIEKENISDEFADR